MLWCCDRLLTTLNFKNDGIAAEDTDGNFVESMDTALEMLEPLMLYPNPTSRCTTISSNGMTTMSAKSIDFAERSQTIRSTVEKLIRHALAFICVASENDKQPLMTLCHRVMQTCIEFYEICCNTDTATEDDKRLKAEQVQYTLNNLDKLVNDCLLRLFYIVFAELNQNPVSKLRTMTELHIERNAVDQQIDKFDDILERLIQIGAFAVAYSQNAKGKLIQLIRRACPFMCSPLLYFINVINVQIINLT